MKRREALRITALATGCAVSVPIVNSLLTACTSPETATASTGELHFFDSEEFQLVSVYTDTILPKTDSPSATETGVHKTIDHMVGRVYPEEDRLAYREAFNELKKEITLQDDFLKMTDEDRKRMLLTFESQPDTPAGMAHMHLKQQTLAYYLSTEEIGKNFLVYLPVPGGYEPCISVNETNGKAWAI